MKIILEEKDKNYAERINTALGEGEEIALMAPVHSKDKKYYIEFTCTDIGKANAFIMAFLFNDDNSKELEEEIGINVTALNYKLLTKDSVNEILQDTIRKIEEL